VWKVFGTGAGDAWLVGSNGVSLHWDGSALSPGDTGIGSSLFTVHARTDGRYAAVGGLATGIIVEYDGGAWTDVTPNPPPPGLSGVCLGQGGEGVAVGLYGAIYDRADDGWHEQPLDFAVDGNLHGAWIDPAGGRWAVGGQTFTLPLTDGVLIYQGDREIAPIKL
jgi:hypothetical protein